ncbi:MAG: HAMP domain-containing sensor histidine kinase [Saprospiraceae bacterium]
MPSSKTYILDKFRTKIIIHILIMVFLALFGFYLTYIKASVSGLLVTALIFFYTVITLFKLVNKTNRDLAHFLMSIRFDDFETSFSRQSTSNGNDENLHEVFNLITGKFRDLRSQKESQHQFLLSLVEQVETGLICFDDQWQTVMMNRAMKDMLRKSYVPSLKSILKIDKGLHDTMLTLSPGDKKLLDVNVQNTRLQLALLGSQIKMNDELIRIFVIQNISTELDNQEIRSWQKLIRILTHEIMNSVSPVVSLASTTDDMLKQAKELDKETISKMHKAIQAIKHRGEALLSFTERYRALTRVPPPVMENVDFINLVDQIIVLYDAEMNSKNIELLKKYPNHKLQISADPGLLEQTIINLLKNAMEAVKDQDNGKIEIQIFRDSRNTIFQIADNGNGIEESMIDQIFIPFFTTKDQGSGIGLSLSRQIILMHNGTIDVQSEVEKGSVFIIRL